MKPSELCWILADYTSAEAEPPARVIDFPTMCEAELMTNEEVEEFIKDSIATMRILTDKRSPRLDTIQETFKADMAALFAFGRMDEDEYNNLTDETNLRF